MADLALRPLSVGEIIDYSLRIYRRSFGTVITIALVANAIPVVLGVYIVTSGGVAANTTLWFLNLILSLILGALATAATVFVVSENYLGQSIAPGEAFSRATGFIGQLIVLSFLVGLAVGIGFILLVIPALVIAAGLMVSTPALVLEGVGATTAMSRSWQLTKGFKLKMLGVAILVVILIMLPSLVIGFFAGMTTPALGAGRNPTAVVIPAALGQLVSTILYPLMYCAITVAYYDLRIRKEGFDLELLESTLQHPTLPAHGTGASGTRSFG